MPLTVTFRAIAPEPIKSSFVNSPEDLLKRSCPSIHHPCLRVLHSSFDPEYLESASIAPSSRPAPNCALSHSANSLIWSLFEAYSNHHDVTIRPEHVWFSILSQLSCYINAHAGKLRSFFVSHQGKKKLQITSPNPDLENMDMADLVLQLTDQMQKSLRDPEMRDWALPDFSTTTEEDKAVTAVMFMGAMQRYLSYDIASSCGFPSVTLLGEKRDYEQFPEKVEKIEALGVEPAQFAELLKAAIRGFIRTFDRPQEFLGF